MTDVVFGCEKHAGRPKIGLSWDGVCLVLEASGWALSSMRQLLPSFESELCFE